MSTDSLTQLSRAIDAALEAVTVLSLLLLSAAVATAAALEIRNRVRRRRRRRAGRRIEPAGSSEILSR
jgi:hypothetical protein